MNKLCFVWCITTLELNAWCLFWLCIQDRCCIYVEVRERPWSTSAKRDLERCFVEFGLFGFCINADLVPRLRNLHLWPVLGLLTLKICHGHGKYISWSFWNGNDTENVDTQCKLDVQIHHKGVIHFPTYHISAKHNGDSLQQFTSTVINYKKNILVLQTHKN